jgi:hypothetical protein
MTEDQEAQSGRARERSAAKARKMAKLAWSQNSFDLLASGYTPEQIAEVRKASVRTIRREIDSAIARRRLDAPERYVHLQVARLTKALRFADAALERGDLKAAQALVQVVAAMDRYHGLSEASRDLASPGSSGPLELQPTAALPPPLKLFHAVSPPKEAPAESETVTVLGA